MAERSNAAVLKTVESQGSVGSNPTLSARERSCSSWSTCRLRPRAPGGRGDAPDRPASGNPQERPSDLTDENRLDVGWRPGLCATCVHARIVQTSRQSRFVLCELSRTDPRFRRYPNLPVLTCDGFEARNGTSQVTTNRP